MKLRRRWPVFASMVATVLALFAAAYALTQASYLPTPAFLMKRPAPTPTPADTRDARWRQAIEYLGSQLPYLHVNPYFKISEATFQQSVTQLAAKVPDLNDEQIIVEMLRIVASLGDGHTKAFPDAKPVSLPNLPLKIVWLDDGLVVTAASPEYAQAVGARIVEVGDRAVLQVCDAVTPLIAADNEVQLLNNTPTYLAMPAILYGLGLIPQRDYVTLGFEAQDGSRFRLVLRPVSDYSEPFIWIYEKAGVQRPLCEEDRQAFYWYRYLPVPNTIYVQYNVCAEEKGKPFRAFVDEVFSLIDHNQVARLVLDVRYNGGGNEGVLAPLIKEIKARPALDAPGKLFVIIGRGTFSSALQNAITLRRETKAILVGEPTGGKPNHYGEVRHFRLPNVGLLVQYSTRYWHNYPKGDPLTLEPDISAAVTMNDLLAGRDPALEAALRP